MKDVMTRTSKDKCKSQTNITGNLWKLTALWEAVGFREHDRQEEELLEKRYERCKQEYDREKAKLDELYAKKKQARQEALQYLKNRCGDIYRLDGSLLAILDKYMTGQKKKGEEEKESSASDTISKKSPVYFPMKLLSAIHETCNGEQFEEINELDFYANMNLQPCASRLKVRKDEKARVCYLIFLMGETLSKPDREKWKEEIMKTAGDRYKNITSPNTRHPYPGPIYPVTAIRYLRRKCSQYSDSQRYATTFHETTTFTTRNIFHHFLLSSDI